MLVDILLKGSYVLLSCLSSQKAQNCSILLMMLCEKIYTELSYFIKSKVHTVARDMEVF